MPLIISDDIIRFTQLSEREFMIDLAIYLYDKGRISIGKARNLAGLDQLSFQQEMAKRGVYIRYEVADLHDDLRTLGLTVQ